MRRTVLVFVTVGLLALAGCQGGGSSPWSQAPGGDETTPVVTPTDDRNTLASCLEGTWALDEAVLTAVLVAGVLESMEDPEMTTAVTSASASQIVTLSGDDTFTATTDMSVDFTLTYKGQTAPASIVLTASAAGTWRTSGETMAITPDGSSTGTMSTTALGQTQTEDLGGEDSLIIMPTRLTEATCQGNTLTFDGQGLADEIPDAPQNVVFTRQ
ncbi:MAG: hypothetical protein FWF02_08545 [Micrococcales bacterium]|nr:hypothetical protein [Micrococcales bacterium]MCL2667736.1 hypothetical protein [Micrococcales bacterium]